jgi:hypothetical protein
VRLAAAIAAIALAAMTILCAVRAPAAAETDLGVLAALLAGTHFGSDNPGPVSGFVPGALLEASQIWPRARIHLEGFPQIGATAPSTGVAGTSSATLSLLNAEAQVDLDKRHRFRLGAGFQVVNLSNFNGNNGDRNYARVTSPLFTAVADLPAGRERSVEMTLTGAPNVRGILHVFAAAGTSRTPKPEQGGEVDYSAAYAWHFPGATYLLGFRGLSYHTRNTDNGELVDSNVGAGVTFEARFRFGRK